LGKGGQRRLPAAVGLVFEAHRLFVSLSLRLKDLLGPVTRVKKTQKKLPAAVGGAAVVGV